MKIRTPLEQKQVSNQYVLKLCVNPQNFKNPFKRTEVLTTISTSFIIVLLNTFSHKCLHGFRQKKGTLNLKGRQLKEFYVDCFSFSYGYRGKILHLQDRAEKFSGRFLE